jgi:glycosyltransferase involved in cell wall biosynthesis
MNPNLSGQKKILVIDFLYPLPENIGRSMRTMNFVRFFRKYGDVDLLYFYPKSEEADGGGVFNKEFFVRHPTGDGTKERKWHQKIRGRSERLLKRRPWLITEWSSEGRRKYLSIVQAGNYDIVFCRYVLDTYPLFDLPETLKRRVVLDFDDVFSESLYGFYAKYDVKILSRIKNWIQKYFLMAYEKKCLEFGAALFVTRHDQEKVAGKGKKGNTHVIPNIFPCNVFFDDGPGSGYPNRDTFLFIGTLDYAPNVEGLKWFIDSVFKPVSERAGNARLLVVGRAPTPEVRTLCGSVPDIELHPDVPDVLPFYKRCGIVVVPILAGGGTRIKILEAAMAGRPVLATPMGANGLDVIDGKDLFLFTDKKTFMESCDKLNDKEVYDSVVCNMKFLVKDRYSPESFAGRMAEAIRPFL